MTGQVLIDGIDISTLGIHDLRSKLALIPQDSMLFSGTIKSNLDPLDTLVQMNAGRGELAGAVFDRAAAQHSQRMLTAEQLQNSDPTHELLVQLAEATHTVVQPDARWEDSEGWGSIWAVSGDSSAPLRLGKHEFQTRFIAQCGAAQLYEVLDLVQMKDAVKSSAQGLECEVLEGGKPWSAGQQQLICMARALLRVLHLGIRIVLLDEATASCDVNTDQQLQSMLRDKLQGCTVITVAHRINTIADSDRVMVLEAGQIDSFKPPQELLADPDSLYSILYKESVTKH